MPVYRTKQERISIAGVDDLVIRSLLDRQQFADRDGAAERLGISSAAWPLFGLLWPSGALLAARLGARPVTAGEKILEIGCGLALASLVGHRRGADVTGRAPSRAASSAPDGQSRPNNGHAADEMPRRSAAPSWSANCWRSSSERMIKSSTPTIEIRSSLVR